MDHCVKVLCFYHPDDDEALKAEQTTKLMTAFEAARKVGREILVEIIASKAGPLDDDAIARVLTELYDAGFHGNPRRPMLRRRRGNRRNGQEVWRAGRSLAVVRSALSGLDRARRAANWRRSRGS